MQILVIDDRALIITKVKIILLSVRYKGCALWGVARNLYDRPINSTVGRPLFGVYGPFVNVTLAGVVPVLVNTIFLVG